MQKNVHRHKHCAVSLHRCQPKNLETTTVYSSIQFFKFPLELFSDFYASACVCSYVCLDKALRHVPTNILGVWEHCISWVNSRLLGFLHHLTHTSLHAGRKINTHIPYTQHESKHRSPELWFMAIKQVWAYPAFPCIILPLKHNTSSSRQQIKQIIISFHIPCVHLLTFIAS